MRKIRTDNIADYVVSLLIIKVQRGKEEVVVMVRWESEEHWKQWEKSEAHIVSHKGKIGNPKPEYIVNIEVGKYEVNTVKKNN
nr:antibiotic biosynthesis monooxygenase [Shimazuella alba]